LPRTSLNHKIPIQGEENNNAVPRNLVNMNLGAYIHDLFFLLYSGTICHITRLLFTPI